MRIFDPRIIREQTDPYERELLGFYPEEWVADLNNISLADERGNIALFEYEFDGLYTGHMFFEDRGKKAVLSAKALLQEALNLPEVEIIRGLTPLQKLGARWLSRQIGFTSHGVVDTAAGPCELFIISKGNT